MASGDEEELVGLEGLPDPEWEAENQFTAPRSAPIEAPPPTARSRRTAPRSTSYVAGSEVEGYEPPLSWDLSPTLQRLAPQRRPSTGAPGQGVACATCPVSIWFVAPAMVRCHCPAVMVVTWETGSGGVEINLCDARERAIELEMQRRQEELEPA